MDCDRECDSNRNKPDPKTNLTDDVTLSLASVPEFKFESEGKGPQAVPTAWLHKLTIVSNNYICEISVVRSQVFS